MPIKEVDQQDIQALHRVRERLIGARTALIKEVHGLMLEYGIVLPKGVAKFRPAVVEKLEADKDKLTALSHELFWQLVSSSIDMSSGDLFDLLSTPLRHLQAHKRLELTVALGHGR